MSTWVSGATWVGGGGSATLTPAQKIDYDEVEPFASNGKPTAGDFGSATILKNKKGKLFTKDDTGVVQEIKGALVTKKKAGVPIASDFTDDILVIENSLTGDLYTKLDDGSVKKTGGDTRGVIVGKGTKLATAPTAVDNKDNYFYLTELDGANKAGFYKSNDTTWIFDFAVSSENEIVDEDIKLVNAPDATLNKDKYFLLKEEDGANKKGIYKSDGTDWLLVANFGDEKATTAIYSQITADVNLPSKAVVFTNTALKDSAGTTIASTYSKGTKNIEYKVGDSVSEMAYYNGIKIPHSKISVVADDEIKVDLTNSMYIASVGVDDMFELI